jgi:zinc protease
VKLRDELGAAYSPGAGSVASDTYPGYGYLLTHVEVDPTMIAKVTDMIVAIGDDLAKNGITEDELVRARQPLLTMLKQSLRDNGYWLGPVLSRAQEKPEVLDWSRTRDADTMSITVAELSKIAANYLTRDHASHIVVTPVAAPAPVAPKS